MEITNTVGRRKAAVARVFVKPGFLDRIQNNALNSWRTATEYTLGRIAEREKRYTDAAAHYRRTKENPTGPGNELRARWLEKAAGKDVKP